MEEQKVSALDSQVGGNHYKAGTIQPVEFLMKNPQLDFAQVNMIKYAHRHKDKKGMEDLMKIVHYAMFAAEFNYDSLQRFREEVYALINGDNIYEQQNQSGSSLRESELFGSAFAGGFCRQTVASNSEENEYRGE